MVVEIMPEPEDIITQTLTRVANGIADRHAPGINRDTIPGLAAQLAAWMWRK